MNAANDNEDRPRPPSPDPVSLTPAPDPVTLYLVIKTYLHRLGHKAHKAENYAHLSYFAAIVMAVEYKAAALACFILGCIALVGGEDA